MIELHKINEGKDRIDYRTIGGGGGLLFTGRDTGVQRNEGKRHTKL